MKTKLTSLNFIRAAACMGVFTFHCYISHLGAWAVSVFIMMSGFLLVYNGLDRADSFPEGAKACAGYAFKKIRKLYPLYFITLIALILRIVILAPENPPVDELIHFGKQFVFDFLLIQSWPMGTDYAFSHNAVGWYLSTAIFLYFTFPYILRRIKRLSGVKQAFRWVLIIFALMIVTAVLASVFYDNAGSLLPDSVIGFKQWFVQVFPLYRLGDFAIGCLLGYIFSVVPKDKFNRAKTTALEILAIAATVLAQIAFNKSLVPEILSYNVLYIPANALLIYSFALGSGRISTILDGRISSFFADYSTEIFLTHFAVIKFASPFATVLPVPFHIQQYCFLFFAIIATLLCVYLYRSFSRRFPFFSVR